MSIETVREKLNDRLRMARAYEDQSTSITVSDLEAILAHLQPSPDLRGLVEQWRQEAASYPPSTGGKFAAVVMRACANDLEAALATTPEPTSMEKIHSVIESLKNEAEGLRYDVGEKARVSALRHTASRLERIFGIGT